MLVSYNGLFKQLIDKGWNKTEFAREVGISSNTLAKLSKNELVSLEVLVRICQRLDCPHEPPAGDGIERAIKRSDERTKGRNVFRHE